MAFLVRQCWRCAEAEELDRKALNQGGISTGQTAGLGIGADSGLFVQGSS